MSLLEEIPMPSFHSFLVQLFINTNNSPEISVIADVFSQNCLRYLPNLLFHGFTFAWVYLITTFVYAQINTADM